MRISDWSSDVCSSDLVARQGARRPAGDAQGPLCDHAAAHAARGRSGARYDASDLHDPGQSRLRGRSRYGEEIPRRARAATRSEEHTSELQSLMRISYAVFCLKKKNK